MGSSKLNFFSLEEVGVEALLVPPAPFFIVPLRKIRMVPPTWIEIVRIWIEVLLGLGEFS